MHNKNTHLPRHLPPKLLSMHPGRHPHHRVGALPVAVLHGTHHRVLMLTVPKTDTAREKNKQKQASAPDDAL